ncbi:MAG: TonB-dependent receptor [Lysobacterales bacterium]
MTNRAIKIPIAICLVGTLASYGSSMSLARATDIDSASANENALQMITVTARKRKESLRDVPISVTTVTGAQLARAGIDSFDQVLATIPNASQSSGIAGSIQGLVSIRGISTLIRFVGLETGVGYYVDGVYMGRPENFNRDLIDIERIEVLRGPQGAVLGKNTIAGAINIVTREPSQNFQGSVEAQIGNFDHLRLRGHVSGGISDNLAGSLSLGYVAQDGFVKHVGDGPDLDTADLTTVRGTLVYEPSSQMRFTLAADALTDRGEPVLFEVTEFAFFDDPTLNTPFTTNQDQPNFVHRDNWGVSLTGEVAVGDSEWTTIAAYRDSSFDAGLDDDKLPVRVFPDLFGQETEAVSLESRFSGMLTKKWDYLAGIYYYKQDSVGGGNFALGDFLTGVSGFELPITLDSAVDTESYALFFNTNYPVSARTTLELGGRWLSESKDAFHIQNDQTGIFGSTNFSRSRSDDDFSPTVSLSYAVNENHTGYLRYAEGFKSSGFNTDFVFAGANLEVDPESATSIEAGLKSSLLDRRMQLNLAVFSTDYEDLQLSQIVGGGVSLNNAAEAEISGVEFELAARVGERLNLNASVGYLDADYNEFPGCPAPGSTPANLTRENCAGNQLNLAPEWTSAASAQFTMPVNDWGNLVLRTDWNYRSRVYFEPQNDPRLSGASRSLVNLSVGLVRNHWEVVGWVRNTTDETYINFADDRTAIGVLTTAAYGPPRTYGITLRAGF